MRSNRVGVSLRLSLLAALGLLPAACAGATEGSPAGSNGGATAGSNGGATATGHGPTCTSPQTNPANGIVFCEEGYTYRTKSAVCGDSNGTTDTAAPAPGPTTDPHTLPRVTEFVNCANDTSVCEQFQYGYCLTQGGFEIRSACQSGCLVDADCGAGAMCRCDGTAIGVCRYDHCRSDDDCDPGYHCASYSEGCGSSPYSCQTAHDDCASCQGVETDQSCLLRDDGHRECGGGTVCGRPFLVETEARVADAVTRCDWNDSGNPGPRLDHLTPLERRALAEHWTKMGQMEHASIAAFARFSLQLLSLGAPPELVEACTAALADETAHTRLCFGFASAYAGHAIGPGPLDISGSLEVTSLPDVVDLVIVEGCFGETSAALEALEAADTAADPVIRAVYEQIASDEQRHAELAFRFVRWALERDHDGVAERIETALAEGERISASVRDVAVPCLEALLTSKRAA